MTELVYFALQSVNQPCQTDWQRGVTVAAQGCRCTRVSAALHANLPALVVCVGLLSLVQDSWLSPLPHRGNLHALFGILLWLCIVERYYARLNLAPPMSVTDIRPLSRHLSRLVYLLLYGLMLVRLLIDCCAAPHHASLHAAADFQSYLVCGVLALITIHLLAAWCRHLVGSAAETPLRLLHGNGLQRNGRLT